jgi:lysozyme
MATTTTTGFLDTDAVRGIDVSHFQGQINWAQVAAAGIQFCYVKATDGIAFSDVRFQANFGGSKAAGLRTGAYHFLRAGSDAEKQAESFLHLVPTLDQGDLPPALDIEIADGTSGNAILDAAQVWLEAVENVLQRRPLIYTIASFWNSTLAGSTRFEDYFLWIADYGARTAPRLPTGRTTYEIWQFSQTGSVPGIAGNVDLDRFGGSLEDLNALASG